AVRSGPASKKIQTHGDWIMAWNVASRAISFVFPHRARELREYGEYINRLFGAVASSEAQRVIRFDEAVRTFVGARNNLQLTDFGSFEHLKITCLASYGAHVKQNRDPKASESKKQVEKTDEICNKFNSARGCGFCTGRCRYQHSCLKCGKSGHGAPECS
ncbi:hypothetical protein B0H13DRAFT_1506482, partial [Mycena leptocephala]